MLGKRMFVQISLLVFVGIICSVLISCGSAETTPQTNLYTLEDALTLAAQTLQAESQAATPSNTPTPVEKASVSNEQTESEENPEEPVVPVTGDDADGSGSSSSSDSSEGTDPSVEEAQGAEPNGGNGSGDRNLMLSDIDLGGNTSYSVDPNKILAIHFSESMDTSSCHYEATNLCGAEKIEFLHNYQISSVPSPTTINDPDVRKEDQEDKEEPSNIAVVKPTNPIEIPPLPPITLPGQPPLPPFPPPIFP